MMNCAFFERRFRDFTLYADGNYYDAYSEEDARQFVVFMQEHQQKVRRYFCAISRPTAAGKAWDSRGRYWRDGGKTKINA